MTRQQRRNKTAWIKTMKKHGYTWRRGRLWQQWRWTVVVGLRPQDLPIVHADHDEGVSESQWSSP